MKQKIKYTVFAFILMSVNTSAQTNMMEVLRSVEMNNKTLKAAKQSANVQKIDAKTGIYPSDISVDYEYLFGNKASNNQRESELTVAQEFDFPTAYFQKNKIANLKADQADIQYKVIRQDVLLAAKTICIELTYLNKTKAILDLRLKNAERLNTSYKKRLEAGDANVLEVNKIALELLNVQNESRINDVEIDNNIQKLTELNGGETIAFNDTSYYQTEIIESYQTILSKAIEINPELKQQEQEKKIAAKTIGLAKSLSLPKLSMGYKMNISKPEKYHGFTAGISIPLWENKNTVKRAKAEATLIDLEIDNIKTSQENELKQLYDKVQTLKKINAEYQRLLTVQDTQNYLDKALSLGQISLLEYLTEMSFLHQSIESFLQTEREYYATLAELMKVEL